MQSFPKWIIHILAGLLKVELIKKWKWLQICQSHLMILLLDSKLSKMDKYITQVIQSKVSLSLLFNK